MFLNIYKPAKTYVVCEINDTEAINKSFAFPGMHVPFVLYVNVVLYNCCIVCKKNIRYVCVNQII